MNIVKKEHYTLITPTENSFEYFMVALDLKEFIHEHIILNLDSSFKINTTQLDSLSEISIAKKEHKTSFIIIAKGIEIDDLKDETLSVVPTLTEAEDTLEMDDIERDLDF